MHMRAREMTNDHDILLKTHLVTCKRMFFDLRKEREAFFSHSNVFTSTSSLKNLDDELKIIFYFISYLI